MCSVNLKQEILVLSLLLLMNVNTMKESNSIKLTFSLLAVPIQKKKIVFVTARIHPGETNSSYMMRGLLEFITSDDKIAQVLLFIHWRIGGKNVFFFFVNGRNYDLS